MVIESRISLILSFVNATEVTLQEKCRRGARGLLVLNSVGLGAYESTSMTSHVENCFIIQISSALHFKSPKKCNVQRNKS